MAEEYEDEAEEDEEIEEASYPKEKRAIGRPKKEALQQASKNRFIAFAQQQRIGIYDTMAKKIHTEDMWEALAEILSKVDRIERSLA